MIKLLNFLVIIFFTGCGLMENRTFVDEMEKDTDGFWVANRDFFVVGGDEGKRYRSQSEILQRTPASTKGAEEMIQDKSLDDELAFKESRLKDTELAQYNEYGQYLETVSEKIYYLDLSPQERAEYVENKGWGGKSEMNYQNDLKETNRARIKSFMSDNSAAKEVWLGMDEGEVMKNWGRPTKIEVAGNPRHRNERWVFYDRGRSKYIYFENGKVQGWAID